jgi:hypothetical protein
MTKLEDRVKDVLSKKMLNLEQLKEKYNKEYQKKIELTKSQKVKSRLSSVKSSRSVKSVQPLK